MRSLSDAHVDLLVVGLHDRGIDRGEPPNGRFEANGNALGHSPSALYDGGCLYHRVSARALLPRACRSAAAGVSETCQTDTPVWREKPPGAECRFAPVWYSPCRDWGSWVL